MANPTSNFGWQMPTPTDLVTDLPADFEVFGQAVDTSLADLKGGSTGQVLSKNSNTDMDFVWVTSDDANAIQNTIVDAKGDLIGASAADTPARLAVGANDLFLTAASGEATGLKWAGGWTSFTPSINNITVGNGTLFANYQIIGKTVNLYFKLTFGTTTSISGVPSFFLPVAGARSRIGLTGGFIDAGVKGYLAFGEIAGGQLYIYSVESNGTYANYSGMSSTIPFTWAVNDYIEFSVSYEAA